MEHFFPLVDRQEIAEDTMEFTFDTSGSDFDFKPGQHADYTLIDPPQTDAEGDIRTFSFANAPGENKIQFATRMRDTAFKNSLKTIPLGTKVKVKGPMGRMTLHQDETKPVVFLVGGIGITPFISMLRFLATTASYRPVILIYSNKNEQAAAYYSELHELEAKLPAFEFVPTFTDEQPEGWQGETGRIEAAMVKKYVSNTNDAVFYTAGPPAMVSAIIKLTESLDVPDIQIRSEDFDGY